MNCIQLNRDMRIWTWVDCIGAEKQIQFAYLATFIALIIALSRMNSHMQNKISLVLHHISADDAFQFIVVQ